MLLSVLHTNIAQYKASWPFSRLPRQSTGQGAVMIYNNSDVVDTQSSSILRSKSWQCIQLFVCLNNTTLGCVCDDGGTAVSLGSPDVHGWDNGRRGGVKNGHSHASARGTLPAHVMPTCVHTHNTTAVYTLD